MYAVCKYASLLRFRDDWEMDVFQSKMLSLSLPVCARRPCRAARWQASMCGAAPCQCRPCRHMHNNMEPNLDTSSNTCLCLPTYHYPIEPNVLQCCWICDAIYVALPTSLGSMMHVLSERTPTRPATLKQLILIRIVYIWL